MSTSKQSFSTFCVIVFVHFGQLFSQASCSAQSFTPTGPVETAEIENWFFDTGIPAGFEAIWPRPEFLKNGSPADLFPRKQEYFRTWLSRVLKADFHPENGNWNINNWMIAPNMRFPFKIDYLFGHFQSADERVTRIELQNEYPNYPNGALSPYISLTIHSKTLFSAENNDDEDDIRKMLETVLNIPEDVKPHIELIMKSKRIGQRKTPVIYGKIIDSRNKKKNARKTEENDSGATEVTPRVNVSLNREKPRMWYSPMSFSIFENRLCIGFYTTDWQRGDRSME